MNRFMVATLAVAAVAYTPTKLVVATLAVAAVAQLGTAQDCYSARSTLLYSIG